MNTIALIVTIILAYYVETSIGLTENDCIDSIYNQCSYDPQTKYTAHEIMTAQRYIQQRFAVTNPKRPKCHISADKPPCIRKEIKCLSDEELHNLTTAWTQLYTNGVIDRLTAIHSDHWGAAHKFSESVRWHFHLINLLEKELQKINPTICMPYWNFPFDFAYPENSKVFRIFGHAGNASNDYCVPDGPFSGVQCNFPEPHCLRRQWRLRTKLDPFKSPEFMTAIHQMTYLPQLINELFYTLLHQLTPEMILSMDKFLKYKLIALNPLLTPYAQRVAFEAQEIHYETHLSIGGWNGDISVPLAPNDPLFYLFHNVGNINELKWQLSNDLYLVPKSYNFGVRYDNKTSTIWLSDIDSDKFAYFQTPVKESFQFGYGDNCYLYDVLIAPINQIVRLNQLYQYYYQITNETCVPELDSNKIAAISSLESLPFPFEFLPPCKSPPLPVAAQRLKHALPPKVFEKWFPAFASNKWSLFEHTLEPIDSRCNPPSSACRAMPVSLRFNATAEGRRQYEAFKKSVANLDICKLTDEATSIYEHFMNTLKHYNYCSPYV